MTGLACQIADEFLSSTKRSRHVQKKNLLRELSGTFRGQEADKEKFSGS